MCYGSSEYVEVVPYSITLMTESSEVIIDANKRGALAEQLVQGVHRTRLPGPVEEVIEGHLREEYASALSSDPSDTYIHEADTPGYLLFTSDDIEIDRDIRWEPDTTFAVDVPRAGDDRGVIHYPVEVKSGTSELSDAQKEDIPYITANVGNIHPIYVWVNLDDLPNSYELEVTLFQDIIDQQVNYDEPTVAEAEELKSLPPRTPAEVNEHTLPHSPLQIKTLIEELAEQHENGVSREEVFHRAAIAGLSYHATQAYIEELLREGQVYIKRKNRIEPI